MEKDGKGWNNMNKEELKKIIKDNSYIIAIVLIAGVVLFLVNSNVDVSSVPVKNNTQDASININGRTNISGNTINLSETTINVTDEDKNFKNWVYLSFRPIVDDITCVSKAAKIQNFSDTKRCGRFLADDSNITLGQIDRYNVSLSLEEARDEYRKSLRYFNLGGVNLYIGANNGDLRQMYNATVYIQNGTSNMERVIMLLRNDEKRPETNTG